MNPATPVRPALDRARLAAAEPALEVVEEAPSTNALLATRVRELAEGAGGAGAEHLVLVTEHQTAGRGRLGRVWETPARAALTFSVLLRPTRPAQEWPWLPLLTGLAVRAALLDAGADVGLKWPNDVLVGDRKLAGILVERHESPSGPVAIVGIGLNVSTTAEELPTPQATSLAVEGVLVDRTDLLLGILAALRHRYAAWQRDGVDELRVAYARACVTVGRAVRVDLPSGESLTGTATDVDPGGRLLVDTGDGDGSPHAVGAGDVVHVRAVG